MDSSLASCRAQRQLWQNSVLEEVVVICDELVELVEMIGWSDPLVLTQMLLVLVMIQRHVPFSSLKYCFYNFQRLWIALRALRQVDLLQCEPSHGFHLSL